MIAIARENDISIFLATWEHPNIFPDYASMSHYEQGFRENNKVVEHVGESEGVPVYNFALEMPQERKFWIDGRYGSEEGAKVRGKLFARFIFEHPQLQKEIQEVIGRRL